MTSPHPYTVPIIAGDLRRAEFVKQLADTLDYMDSVSQDVFNRIAIRLNVYRAQLNKFDERIQNANAHIDRIKGSKRAIQVHSSARYPVEQNRSKYRSIFEIDEENKPPALHYHAFRLNETVDKFIDPNDKESKSHDETLIVLKPLEDNAIQKTKKNVLNGLGKPPSNIKSVVSFLTYNTQENPYTKSTKIDPLNMGGRTRRPVEEPNPSRFSETPLPAFYSQKSERPLNGNFGYNPTLGVVPQLSLPDNLPELGNYATFDDNTTIEWTQQQMTSIAPSFAISTLPDINELSSNTPNVPQAEPSKTTALPPPAPPADLPAIIPLISASTTVPPPAPPLPPLPPPSASLPVSLPSVLAPPPPTDQAKILGDNEPDDDDGNPLLAQIRAFGRDRKLKSAASTDAVRETPLPAASHEQENIMDTLKKRLMQRRGFITGETLSSTPSTAEKPIAAPVPSTGSSFTDEIARKAKEAAEEQQRRKEESDDDDANDNEEDWE